MNDLKAVFQPSPNAGLLEKVLRDPIVRALRPRTRLFYLACVMLAWEPFGDDDQRCGCLRRVGVGPYEPGDVAEIIGLSRKRVRKEACRLRSVGLADLVQIDGQWYLRILGCRRAASSGGPGVAGPPPPDADGPAGAADAVPTAAQEASPDDEEPNLLPPDDPRVKTLVEVGVAASVACRYGGDYEYGDIACEILRLNRNRGIRNLPAVLTSNLQAGRIERIKPWPREANRGRISRATG